MHSSLYRHSPGSARPLRVGLLLDTAALPRCFAEVVDHIAQSNFARLELVVFNTDERKAAQPRPPRSPLRKMFNVLTNRRNRKSLLFSLYARSDRRRVAPSVDPLSPVDCSGRFQHIDAISVTPLAKGFTHRFPVDAIENIRERQLDVLIRFGFNILRGEILTAAQYGVWSYHHGDNDYYRGGPAHFWELYEGNPISGVILQVLTEQLDAGKVLYKGLFPTHPGWSLALNRVSPYWGASTFMIQKLRELHHHGWERIEQTVVRPAPYRGRKKIYTVPSNWEMVRWLGPLLIRKSVRRLVRRPTDRHWRLAIRVGGQSVLRHIGSDSAPDMSGFQWIESPEGRFYADPFLIEVAGKPWLFFEDFDYAAGRGRISCAETRNGAISNPVPALERPYHLSYPCVFRDGNTVYMIPETASNGTVELYRCVRFPDVWELEKELFHGRAVDSTLCVDDGLYWFFVTMQEPRGCGTQLWLFYAESLTGEWTPHASNPISTDVRNSRGAGAIFRHKGKLFRPSQDCSKGYGYSFTLNEIVALSRFHYRETSGVTVGPSWARNLVGTHTYSHAPQVEVIDGCTRLPAGRLRGGN
jgi:hypothetical protein